MNSRYVVPLVLSVLALATAGAQSVAVLTDLINGTILRGRSVCLDPNIVPDRGGGSRDVRWPDSVLARLAIHPLVAIDTSAGPSVKGARSCMRSTTVWRQSYGAAAIAGDSGSLPYVMTLLDGRGQPDTLKWILRLDRVSGRWDVAGTVSGQRTTHEWVKPEGCYRFKHPTLTTDDAHIRIDTVVVQVDSVADGIDDDGLPRRRLRPAPDRIGMGKVFRPSAQWWVSHDTVQFEWGDWNYKLFATFRAAGDSLVGTMFTGTDKGESLPVRVVGRRVNCLSS